MKKMIFDIVMEKWKEWDLGKKPRGLDCLLLNHVTANFVIFIKGKKTPILLIKVSKHAKLEEEFHTLKQINKILPLSTPKPYGFYRVNGYFVLVENFILGKKIFHLPRWEAKVNKSFEQLIALHKGVMSDHFFLDRDHFEKLIRLPINDFLSHNDSAMMRRECDVMLKKFEKYNEVSFPHIPQHGDFSFVNILFSQEKACVIDWEDFGKIDLPLYDVCTLINSLYFGREHFSKFLLRNSINEIFRKNIRKYCELFSIDISLAKILYPMALITFFNKNTPGRFEAMHTTAELVEYFFNHKGEFLFLSNY